MANSADPDSPLESAADVAGPRGTEAFTLLGNETRLAILLALWEAAEPFSENPTDYMEVDSVPFTELRRMVGVDDPGQFHYHLDKLEGRFVERTEDGYELHPAGKAVVRTVIATSGLDTDTFPPAEIESKCSNCGAPSAITYQNHRLYKCCTECDGNYGLEDHHPQGVLHGWRFHPAILSHESAEAIYSAGRAEAIHEYALRFDGVCPTCSGRVDRQLHVCPDHNPQDTTPCPTCHRQYEIAARLVCTVCKAANITSAVQLLAVTRIQPIVEFFGRQGVVPESPFVAETPGITTEQSVESRDPLRVRMTLTLDGSQLELVVDDRLNVVETERKG